MKVPKAVLPYWSPYGWLAGWYVGRQAVKQAAGLAGWMAGSVCECVRGSCLTLSYLSCGVLVDLELARISVRMT